LQLRESILDVLLLRSRYELFNLYQLWIQHVYYCIHLTELLILCLDVLALTDGRLLKFGHCLLHFKSQIKIPPTFHHDLLGLVRFNGISSDLNDKDDAKESSLNLRTIHDSRLFITGGITGRYGQIFNMERRHSRVFFMGYWNVKLRLVWFL